MNRVQRVPRGVRRLGVVLTTGAIVALALAPITNAVHDEDFELDGNVANNGGGTLVDWEDLFTDPDKTKTGGAFAPVPVASLPGDHTVAAFIEDWSLNANGTFNTSDATTFTTGAKDIGEVNTWRCVGANNVTNKGDLTNVYATIVDDGTQTFIYFGAEKTEDNGDNNIGIWLLQGGANCPTPATGNGNAFVGLHADGDIFLVSAFTNGGGVSTITAYAWSTDLDGDGTHNENADDVGLDEEPIAVSSDCVFSPSLPDDRLCATTNRQATKTPATHNPEWSHFSKPFGVNNGIERSTFFEGGIEITGFSQFADECFSTILVNTRSSQELTATLYDYAAGPLGSCDVSLTSTPSTGSGGSTSLGSSTPVTDLAVVSGTSTGGGSAPDPTGTVSFFLCGPGPGDISGCPTGGTAVLPDATLGACTPDVQGNACATSADVRSLITAGGIGEYCFRAVYNPGDDPNYAGKTAEDGGANECFIVTDTSSGTTAQNWLPNDSATFSSAGGSTLAGTVQFTLYEGAGCAGTIRYQETRNIVTDGTGTASSRTVVTTNGDGVGSGLAADYRVVDSNASVTYSWSAVFTSTNSTTGSTAPCETTTINIAD